MLVYVNNFNCIEDDSFFNVMRSVSGWVKKVSGKYFSIEDLISGGDFEINGSYVRTYSATKSEPETYSIMYSHPDREVSGRQWITEIGIVKNEGYTFISILLEISDVSTRVDSKPIPTRPRLVSFLKQNCVFDRDTIGVDCQYIQNDYGNLKYLSHEIFRDNRNYPIILLSAKNDKYPTDYNKLQEQLFGLAQVFVINSDVDSWEMERVVGRRYSCWDGAINIIYPFNSSGNINTNILFKDKIDEIVSTEMPINNYLLSLITHSYNGRKKKNHISPVSTRAKRLADNNKYYKDKVKNLSNESDFKELLDEALNDINDLNIAIGEQESTYVEMINDLEGELERSYNENYKLSLKIKELSRTSNIDGRIDADILIKVISNKLNPESIIEFLEILIPDRLIILDSAKSSAAKSSKFKYSQRLVFLIYKLCTEYLDLYLEKGDSEAKNVLGSAYAANESETVENSKKLSDMRKFTYENKDEYMFQHVSIGVAHNKSETIRVHFLVDSNKGKVVIGYCGEHLPVQSS